MERNCYVADEQELLDARRVLGGRQTHPDGIVARSKAHFVSERPAGDAAVALWTALGLCFAEPNCGAGHVAHRTQGET